MSQSTLWKQSLLVAIGAACFTLTTENIKPAAAASFTAVNFSVPEIDTTNGSWSLGFKFTTNKAVKVTALGFYDDLGNGFTQKLIDGIAINDAPHDVGIFDNSGSLLVKGTVKSEDSLDGLFRYTPVQSTVLQAGSAFFIAAVTGSQNYTFNPTGFSTNPNITFVSSAFRFSDKLIFPGSVPTSGGSGSGQNSDGNKGYFGPNFKADEVAAVPTPALLPGLIGLGIGALRKRKADAAKQNRGC